MASHAACLAPLRASLFSAPRRAVQAHARDAVAFDAALDPHEDLGVHGLRAGVAAPQAPGDGGEEEQRQRRQHQQRRQEDQVLRIEHQAQDVEALRLQIEEHRLAAAPLQPGQAVEEQLRQPDHGPAPRGKPALHRARIDVRRLLVHRHEARVVVGIGADRVDRDDRALHRFNSPSLASILAHSSASGSASLVRVIGFHSRASSAFSAMKACWSAGTSSSA